MASLQSCSYRDGGGGMLSRAAAANGGAAADRTADRADSCLPGVIANAAARAPDPAGTRNCCRRSADGMIGIVNAHRPRWLQNWLERHQTRLSRALHAVGIPLTILAVVLAGYQLYLWRWDLWWRPVLLLVVGYALQFVAHVHEGNDMGEVILVKRLLGRPYTAISPRFGGGVSDS